MSFFAKYIPIVSWDTFLTSKLKLLRILHHLTANQIMSTRKMIILASIQRNHKLKVSDTYKRRQVQWNFSIFQIFMRVSFLWFFDFLSFQDKITFLNSSNFFQINLYFWPESNVMEKFEFSPTLWKSWFCEIQMKF